MVYQEKYSVSKRGQVTGPFSATEIIDLLRMKEISTIHKVKLGQDWLSVSDFIDQYEKGLLPEQNYPVPLLGSFPPLNKGLLEEGFSLFF